MQELVIKWAICSGVLKMVHFTYNGFVKICQIKAYAEFWIAWFVLTFNKCETVYPQSGFFNWLDDTCLEHLVYFFFEGFFEMNRYQSTWGLFLCDVWINLYVIWWSREPTNTFEDVWVTWKYLFFTGYHDVGIWFLNCVHRCRCCCLPFVVLAFEQMLLVLTCKLSKMSTLFSSDDP